MSMKPIIQRSIFFSTVAMMGFSFFVSCDNIPEADRIIPAERPKAVRKILIQEFTGIRCLNCPNAAKSLHQFQESEDGDSAIVVAIHPSTSNFSDEYGGFYLATKTGGEYFDYYKGNELPAAVINQGEINTTVATWIGNALVSWSKEPVLDIDLSVTYDETSHKAVASYFIDFKQAYSGDDMSVLVWITESNIIGKQTMEDGRWNRKYEFNHIFRASLNGTWGTSIGDSFSDGQLVEGKAEIKLEEDWKPENCEIVAFVFKTGDKSVENAESIHLIPAQD